MGPAGGPTSKVWCDNRGARHILTERPEYGHIPFTGEWELCDVALICHSDSGRVDCVAGALEGMVSNAELIKPAGESRLVISKLFGWGRLEERPDQANQLARCLPDDPVGGNSGLCRRREMFDKRS